MPQEPVPSLLLEGAVEHNPEAITISNPGLPDNPIIFANPAFYRMTGYTPAEVLGRNCRFLQGPETNRHAVQKIRERIQAGSSYTVELLNYRKDGGTFWNRLSVVPLRDARGLITHFAGFQSNISEVKNAVHERAELRLLQAQMQNLRDNMQHLLEQMQHFHQQLEQRGEASLLKQHQAILAETHHWLTL